MMRDQRKTKWTIHYVQAPFLSLLLLSPLVGCSDSSEPDLLTTDVFNICHPGCDDRDMLVLLRNGRTIATVRKGGCYDWLIEDWQATYGDTLWIYWGFDVGTGIRDSIRFRKIVVAGTEFTPPCD